MLLEPIYLFFIYILIFEIAIISAIVIILLIAFIILVNKSNNEKYISAVD